MSQSKPCSRGADDQNGQQRFDRCLNIHDKPCDVDGAIGEQRQSNTEFIVDVVGQDGGQYAASSLEEDKSNEDARDHRSSHELNLVEDETAPTAAL